MNLPIETHRQVMIVDDTPANLAFLSDALTDAGYEVLVALSGHTALRQLDLVRPDVILLDAVMPDMDGFETCDRLKARRDTCEIPVIFMTALSDTADVVRGFEMGAVDYVTKPFDFPELLARLQALLRAIGPMWSSEAESGNTPARLTRPHVGLRPVTPFAKDGKRMEPPVSEPRPPYARPAATAPWIRRRP